MSCTLAKTRKQRTITYRIRQLLSERRRKNSIGELELLAVLRGLERFRFHLYGKLVQLFSDHQALEPLLKLNKANKQYSATDTISRQIKLFVISLKHTAW